VSVRLYIARVKCSYSRCSHNFPSPRLRRFLKGMVLGSGYMFFTRCHNTTKSLVLVVAELATSTLFVFADRGVDHGAPFISRLPSQMFRYYCCPACERLRFTLSQY
jgi:hypothetical protein